MGRIAPRLRRTAFGLAAVLLLAACASDAPQDTFKPEGEQADKIFDLVQPVFIVAGVIFVLVNVGVLYIISRFRSRGDDSVPEQTHGNTKLEIGWTLVPAAILVLIAVFTVATILDLERETGDDAVEITVIGQQWWWAYEYDVDGDGEVDFATANDLVIPAATDVDLDITSRDVIHSFWAPRLNGKKDAVPGRTHRQILVADEPGVYYGQCTEYCGLSHGYMRLRVVALPPDEYDAWVENQLQPAVEPSSPLETEGQTIFEAQCTVCHQIRGVNDDTYQGAAQVSGAAPDLTHFASRGVYAGGIFDLYADADGDGFGDVDSGEIDIAQLEEWLRDPPAAKPMAAADNRGMPNLNLSEQQIDALVAYLTSLD